MYTATENNAVEIINILNSVGYDMNQDKGRIEFYSNGFIEERVSSLFIAAQQNNYIAIRAFKSYDYNLDVGCYRYYKNGKIKQKISSLFIAAQFNSIQSIEILKKGNYDFSRDSGLIDYDELENHKTTPARDVAEFKKHFSILPLIIF